MIAFAAFVSLALGCAIAAVLLRGKRAAILSLWGMGLWVGVAYLSVGAEFLALVQWVASTITVISFLFFSLLFGEYSDTDWKLGRSPGVPWLLALPLLLGWVAWIGLAASQLGEISEAFSSAGKLAEIGKQLVEEHWLAVEITALLLFLSVVGAGVIARPDQDGAESSRGRS